MSDKATTLAERLLKSLNTVFDTVSAVIGSKTDVAAVPSTTTSLVAMIKEVYNEVASIAQGTALFAKSSPDTVEIDDIGTYNLELYDIGDAIPLSAEITPGVYQVDRLRNGVLTNIVASAAASKGDGRIYASETFAVADGWAIGDEILVTFSGGSILTDGVTTALPNAYFYSRIARDESIESKVDIVDTNVDTLLTRLSAARALLLDEITALRLAELDAANLPADIDAIITDLSNATDGLGALKALIDANQVDLDAIIANQAGAETISSYDLPNDTAENILLTITNTKRLRLDAIWLDLVNLVENITIKVYHKIDGTNYRQYDVYSWGTAEEDGVLLSPVTINGDWKITVTSAVAQGAIKAIPYNVIKTTMEA